MQNTHSIRHAERSVYIPCEFKAHNLSRIPIPIKVPWYTADTFHPGKQKQLSPTEELIRARPAIPLSFTFISIGMIGIASLTGKIDMGVSLFRCSICLFVFSRGPVYEMGSEAMLCAYTLRQKLDSRIPCKKTAQDNSWSLIQ